MNSKFTIDFLTIDIVTNFNIQHLTQLINDVYDAAEEGMWKTKGRRTTFDAVKELIEQQSVMVCRHQGMIIGAVVVKVLEDGRSGEFGMLVCDPAYRHQGVGRSLVKNAENWAKTKGLQQMTFELWTPRDWIHPQKVILQNWYASLGYTPDYTMLAADRYPFVAAEEVSVVVLTMWRKRLIDLF